MCMYFLHMSGKKKLAIVAPDPDAARLSLLSSDTPCRPQAVKLIFTLCGPRVKLGSGNSRAQVCDSTELMHARIDANRTGNKTQPLFARACRPSDPIDSSAASMNRLPPKLLDTIFQLLPVRRHEEIGSKKSCSLVCKLWLGCIRRHLFSQVCVDFYKRYSFAGLKNLLGSSPGISDAVVRVFLYGAPSRDDSPVILVDDFLFVLEVFTRLKHITLSFNWVVEGATSSQMFVPSRPARVLQGLRFCES